jgi:hypothetical protein
VLGLELVLGRDRIRRHPHDVRAGLLEFASKSRKINGFPGAAGGVGLGVEIQHELAALEVGERQAAAAIARQLERGGLGALRQIGTHVPSFRPFSAVN